MLAKKAAAEVAKAQECLKGRNKAGALACLKRKKMYEAEAARLASQAMQLEAQMQLIESTSTLATTASAMQAGNKALARNRKETSLDVVDDILDEYAEHAAHLTQVQDAMAQPLPGGVELDEEELEAELSELEALDLDAALAAVPAAPARPTPLAAAGGLGELPQVPTRKPQLAPPAGGLTAEEEELAALEAELA